MTKGRTWRRRMADELADEVYKTAGVRVAASDGHPISPLSTVARYLKVRTELRRSISIDGETCRIGSEPVITLADVGAPTRTVFTYSHELAHIILDRHERQRGGSVLEINGIEREWLCDDIGAALLLPGGWVHSCFEDRPTLAEIYALARRAHVSPSTVAVRLRGLGYGSSLMRLRRLRSGRWLVVSIVGVPHEVRRMFRISPRLSEVLDSLGRDAISCADLLIGAGVAAEPLHLSASMSSTGHVSHVLIGDIRCRQSNSGGVRSWCLYEDRRESMHPFNIAASAPGTGDSLIIDLVACT